MSLPKIPEYAGELDRRIVCAANRLNFGYDDSIIIVGARHCDLIMHHTLQYIPDFIKELRHSEEQGFINTCGQFLDRRQAWVVARHNGQILRLCGGQKMDEDGELPFEGVLYSENLY